MAGARPGGGRGRAEEAAPPNRRLHLAPQRKLGGIASCPPPQSGSCLCARGTCAMPPAPGPPKLPHVDPRRGLAQDWLDSAPPLTHFLARCMWASFAPSPRFGLLAIVVSVYPSQVLQLFPLQKPGCGHGDAAVSAVFRQALPKPRAAPWHHLLTQGAHYKCINTMSAGYATQMRRLHSGPCCHDSLEGLGTVVFVECRKWRNSRQNAWALAANA